MVLGRHPVLKGQLSKSWISFSLITVISTSFKSSPPLSCRGHPSLSLQACLHCLPPALNGHWKANHSNKTKNNLWSNFNLCFSLRFCTISGQPWVAKKTKTPKAKTEDLRSQKTKTKTYSDPKRNRSFPVGSCRLLTVGHGRHKIATQWEEETLFLLSALRASLGKLTLSGCCHSVNNRMCSIRWRLG